MTIYDPIRNAHVKATPEEEVRSRLLHYMIDVLGYPKHLLALEKQLCHLPGCEEAPDRRLDIICYAKQAEFPLLLIECKADKASERAKEQVLGYNHYVQAAFVAVADRSNIETGYFDAQKGEYVFMAGLPPYTTLLEAIW